MTKPHRSREVLLGEFATYLRRANLSPVAVQHYVRAVQVGLGAKDMLSPIRLAKSVSAAKVARAGILRWARWRKDRALERSIPLVPYLPFVPLKSAVTLALRTRILRGAADLPDQRDQLALRLVLTSPLRVFDSLVAQRHDVLGWKAVRDDNEFDIVLRRQEWEYVYELLSDRGVAAAYAQLRRRLAQVCDDLGIPRVRPHEFRHLALHEEQRRP